MAKRGKVNATHAREEDRAILRAEELDKKQAGKGLAPIELNPNTKVYKLVKELRAWYDYYAYEP